MDAPTTTSADNGTSGGGGWFTPRKPPPDASPTDDRQPDEVRRPAVVRPVGRPGSDAAPHPSTDASAPPGASAPPSAAPRTQERIPAPGPPTPAQAGVQRPPGAPRPEHSPVAPPPPHEATYQQHPAAPPSRAATHQQHPAPPPPHTAPHEPHGAAPPSRAATHEQYSAAPPPRTAPHEQHSAAPPAENRVPAQRPAPVTENASPDAILIRRTMAEVAPVADKVTSYFYALLFVRHPDLRSLFPAAMDTQRDRLLKALLTAAEHIDNTPVLVDYLQNLGRGHRKYGTRAEHYPAVGECLIGSLSKYAAAIWNPEMEAAWVRAYTTISQVMIDAAAVDELRAPAWWYAEVVAHDLRTPDVAVVTVRPDQPYPFLAGQYTSVETPWWPRIWRHYSFASAPRSDGLLTFHVKAVPAGWVSNALVHRARPGDVIRLGPPAGSMTVDHTTDSGLLCLGGGTGIAPIKALVEDVAEHGDRRPVEVFYGARTDHDLYDIDTMLRLQQAHPWLAVRAIIDQQAHIQLPDAVREFGPWDEYDAYLSGPPGMIRSGVHALRDVGIPSERIRHDSVEELVVVGD
ncbi:globin domain-containing protein [Streptomyces sp. NPDC002619]|uniref:globin domain-containing protein n=1 Tax=Streptomyces sp. NPDC002619 TaxID=3364655 RepID=UPI00368F2912